MNKYQVKLVREVVVEATSFEDAKQIIKKKYQSRGSKPEKFISLKNGGYWDVIGFCEVSGVALFEKDEYYTDEEGCMWLKKFGK